LTINKLQENASIAKNANLGKLILQTHFRKVEVTEKEQAYV
jgi:hypothetical protein